MPQYTKKALAEALKAALQTKPLNKITVKELVEMCQINRQTFYYHFQDIYDLLGWIYQTEAIDSIRYKKSYDTWQQGLLQIFEYIQENKELCINTYRSLARDHLERFLDEVLNDLLGNVVEEIATDISVTQKQKEFITRFYSYAFAGTLLDWLKQGLKTPPGELAAQISIIMDGTIRAAVTRHFPPCD